MGVESDWQDALSYNLGGNRGRFVCPLLVAFILSVKDPVACARELASVMWAVHSWHPESG